MVTPRTYWSEIIREVNLVGLFLLRKKNIHDNQSEKKFVHTLFLFVNFDDSFLALIVEYFILIQPFHQGTGQDIARIL